MTWIRFGGERDFLELFLACERQGLLQLGAAYLVLVQTHPPPCPRCDAFLLRLVEGIKAESDLKAQVLVLGMGFEQLDAQVKGIALELSEPILSKERLQIVLGNFSSQTSVFLFDPYGSLWFAWSGVELAVDQIQEVLKWLDYLALQCPE